MRELNDAFKQDVTGVHFATAVVLGYYLGTGELLFSNAGHLPLLWYHSRIGEWDWLEDRTPYAKDVDGLPLGLISGTSYVQTAVELQAGDMLMLYTDGITETRNETGEELGRDGLLSLARELDLRSQRSTGAIANQLIREVRRFRGTSPQRDDETVILLQRGA
jgi:sigma-B regulation protein RsbU (phosphoserine phosphatase)